MSTTRKNFGQRKNKEKKKKDILLFFFFFLSGVFFILFWQSMQTIRNKDQSRQASSKSFCRRHRQSVQSHHLACYQCVIQKANDILVSCLPFFFDMRWRARATRGFEMKCGQFSSEAENLENIRPKRNLCTSTIENFLVDCWVFLNFWQFNLKLCLGQC